MLIKLVNVKKINLLLSIVKISMSIEGPFTIGVPKKISN
jgi:hypothetical protein